MSAVKIIYPDAMPKQDVLNMFQIHAKVTVRPEHKPVLVFDCETKNYPVAPKGLKVPDEWVANGWDDYTGMGVAVVGFVLLLLNKDKSPPQIHAKIVVSDINLIKDIFDIARVEKWTIAGFNSKGFDANLLQAHGVDLQGIEHYDVSAELSSALGINAKHEKGAMRGLGLDAVAKANDCEVKSGKGVLAPKMWHEGQIEHLVDYCIQDVVVAAGVIARAHERSGLVNPKDNQFYIIIAP